MKIQDNDKYIVSPEYHSERIPDSEPVTLKKPEIKHKPPELRADTIIIPLVSASAYYVFYNKILPMLTENKMSKYIVYFILVGSAITFLTTVLRFIIGWIYYLFERNSKIKKLKDDSEKLCQESIEKGNKYIDNISDVYNYQETDEKLLWSHTHNHKSFLQIRIGHCEEIQNPFRILKWEGKDDDLSTKFKEIADSLIENTELLCRENIPYTIDISEPTAIGIVNADENYKKAFLNNILFLHSPADVTINIIPENSIEKNIPKSYSKEKEKKPVVYIFNDYGNYCAKNPMIIEFTAQLENKASVIIFSEKETDFPSFCDMVYDVKADSLSFRDSKPPVNVLHDIPDISKTEKQYLTLIQSDIPHTENIMSTDIPDMLGLFQFHGIEETDDILKLHEKSASERYPEKLNIPIGIGNNGRHICVDITSAKHGVMAGYTGSGKSQFLLSMMMSLSLLYHPDFVKFTFIDFKGGSSSEQLKNLPHFAGSFTDVDGEEKIIRVITILEQEGKRRQKILQKVFDDGKIEQMEISEYHRYLRTLSQEQLKNEENLPYLLIVIDEFTELMSRYSNFSKDLESVARLGRSRGMFLLLCAQRPFGSLNGQIRSNLGYTICLKTNSAEDSRSAIGNDKAYSLVNKGSGYLWNVETSECLYFQSSYSMTRDVFSGRSQLNITSLTLKNFYLRKNFERDMVFSEELPPVLNGDETLISCCENSFNVTRNKWGTDFDGKIPVGKIDNVIMQKTETAYLNVFNENTVIYGNPATGKTYFLKTILMNLIKSCPPDIAGIFVINAMELSYGSFKDVPHISCIINPSYEEDTFIFTRFTLILDEEIKRRKKILSSKTIEQYNAENPNNRLNYLVCIIDGFDFLREEYPQEYEKIQYFIKKSGKCGVSFIVSTRTNLPSVIKSQFPNIFTFPFRDDSYRELLTLGAVKKPSPFAGRCLTNIANQGVALEMQVMLPVGVQSVDEGFERLVDEEISCQLKGIKYKYYSSGKNVYSAKLIPEMPTDRKKSISNPDYTPLKAVDDFTKDKEFKTFPLHAVMGMRTDTVKPFTADMKLWRMLTILGIPKSGKTTAIHQLIQPVINKIKNEKELGIIIIDNRENSLGQVYSVFENIKVFPQSRETVEFFHNDENYRKIIQEALEKYRTVFFIIEDYPRLVRIAEAYGIQGFVKELNTYITNCYQSNENFKFIFTGNMGDCNQNSMFYNHETNNLNLWIVGGVLSQLGSYDPDSIFGRYRTALPEHTSIYRRMGEIISIKF